MLLAEVGAICGGVEATVDRYLSEPLIEYKSGDPLRWWNKNINRLYYWTPWLNIFLVLHQQVYHQSDCFWCWNLYDEQKHRLSVDHAEMLLYIKYNMYFSMVSIYLYCY